MAARSTPGLRPTAMRAVAIAVAWGGPVTAPATAQVVALVEVAVESAAGGPVAGAAVTTAGDGTAYTDGSGHVTLRGVPPGPVRLLVTALGYLPSRLDVEAVNGRATRAHVVLTPDPVRLEGIDVHVARTDPSPGAVSLVVDSLPPGLRDLAAALAQVPGVTIVHEGGAGAAAHAQIRGSASDQVLVLLDGVPLNSPLTGEVDLSLVDLATIERIVVVPGAQSARYGPRALGGVVLLERRRARAARAESTLGAAAWGEREVGVALDWTGVGPWSAGAEGHASSGRSDFIYDVPDFRGGGRAARDNADFRRVAGSIHLARGTDALTTSLRLHGDAVERGSPGAVAQPSRSGEQTHRRVGFAIRADMGGEPTGLSLLADAQWQRTVYADSTPPFGLPYRQVARVAQYEIAAGGRGALGPASLHAGVDARRVDVRASALAPASRSLNELGVWIGFDWGRALGGRWSLGTRAEGRVDRHDLLDGLSLSPAAMLRLVRGDTRLVASLRSAFAPPGLSDLFFQEGVLVRANPELRPERVRMERSISVERAARLLGVDLDLGATAYAADVDDMILWFPDFRFVWSPNNLDVTRSGVELSAAFAFEALGGEHALSGHVSWSSVEYRGGALAGQVTYRPDRTADVLASIGLPIGAANLRASHVGARRSVAGSALNELPPYTLIDVGFAAPLPLPAVDASVEAAVTNVLDRSAALLVDYPLPGRGWSLRMRVGAPGAP